MGGSAMSGSNRSPSISVAVLGATGIVGQRLVRMLDGHALFHLEEVVGSERRAGRHYAGAAPWAIGGDPPPGASVLRLLAPGEPLRSPFVLSALPAAVAKETELALARSGHVVCTNASAHRMRADTPLIVPEVNGEAISGNRGAAMVAGRRSARRQPELRGRGAGDGARPDSWGVRHRIGDGGHPASALGGGAQRPQRGGSRGETSSRASAGRRRRSVPSSTRSSRPTSKCPWR